MRTPPYNNGKVSIGLYYEPPKYVEYDRDMLEIQKWMIGDPVKMRKNYWINVAYMFLLVFILLVVILQGTV